MGKKIDVKKALSKFRNHWIHENDIRPLREMEESARTEIENILSTVPDDNLKESLSNYISQLPYMDLAGINWVMDNNSIQEIRGAFTTLFDDKKTEAERLDAMWALEGVGHIYSTIFLDIATRGGYLIYTSDLVPALKEAEPGSLHEDFIEVWTIEDLEYFVAACRKFNKKYGFESYAELRAFLRNGYGSEWTFEGF
ncbi:hypothetical protein EU527_17940 [Candidatus Thorarchaeota archaeon]|nr:MAG: hypothetical protein EU527_17940 [Candidatus Thorarchaeota archaeon]